MSNRVILSFMAGLILTGLTLYIFSIQTSGPTECIYLGRGSQEPLDEERFEKIVLLENLVDPLQVKSLPDGSACVIERTGRILMLKPGATTPVEIAKLTVPTFGEVGLDGIAFDNDYAHNGWLYLFYCPQTNHDVLRLSRFTVTNDKLDFASEKVLFEYHIEKAEAAHMGGGMVMTADGTLVIGTGDNSPPIPELPCDQRPGKENHDSFRSAGNSNDLRGKVLRIRPKSDGTYDTPADNLFPDGKDGRKEIFAMGCRNAYRLSVDEKTGWVVWGDVGPNLTPEMGIPSGGYDEINLTRTAGNFGWPMFCGPNEAFAFYDHEKKKVGTKFDVNDPINPSKNNTGLKRVPPPRPALIWYPSGDSKEFPELGSGGRCSMAGPIYRFNPNRAAGLELPRELDGRLLIYDWCRNWIKSVGLDVEGKVTDIKPFCRHLVFRKPMDMVVAPDESLLVVEYGDKWNDNTDGQLVKIVYRRGNRPPVAVASASITAGRHPLTVAFDGSKSFDKDGDPLSYGWNFGTGDMAKGSKASFTFTKPGTYTAELTVTDSHGASSVARVPVRVGNAAPVVRFAEPLNGGFFDWEDTLPYRVDVSDEEDKVIDPKRVVVQAEYRPRRQPADTGPAAQSSEDAGLGLMRRSDCFACHSPQQKGGGPPYTAVATKYRGNTTARETLAKKVLVGGAGVWGVPAMPPHPQHTIEQARLMVDWVLALETEGAQPPQAGTQGVVKALRKPFHRGDAGVYVLTASYTDNGAPGAGPLTGEGTVVLHARRKRAAFFDSRKGVEIVDILEGEAAIVGWFDHDGYVCFRDVNLAGVPSAKFRFTPLSPVGGALEVHADDPAGPLVATVPVPSGTDTLAYRDVVVPLRDPGGVHDLYIVAKHADASSGRVVGLNWVEFAAPKRPRVAMPTVAAAPAARPFVKNWAVADLESALPEVDRGRSFARGKELFTAATCASCHKIAGQGGELGPDLTEVTKRLKEKGTGRAGLLVEILEPSKVIDEKYRTRIITTTGGRVLTGIVRSRDAKSVRIAANAAEPDKVEEVPIADIEEERESPVSMMPPGLLTTLTKEQILDLLAYLEAGGKER